MVAAMRPFAASTAASCVNFGDRGLRATMSSSWHRADCTATLVVLQRSLVATTLIADLELDLDLDLDPDQTLNQTQIRTRGRRAFQTRTLTLTWILTLTLI